MSPRDKRIERAQLKILFQVPFFAPGVARLPVEFDSSVPTACTNGVHIKWNPDWFDTLSDQEVITVLCHEVCHPMLGHLWRVPPGADMEGWNEACDHAVNNMLKGFSEAVKARNLADPFPFPKGNYCCDPQYADMAEETIYAKLPKKPPGAGGGSGGGGGGRKPFGEFVNGNNSAANPVQTKQLKSDWDNTFQQSVEISKGRGTLPACVDRAVHQLFDSQVPWYELLRNWLREQAADDWLWTKPNQQFSGSDFILPVLESERMGPVVFATDTSGSIDGDMLARFQAEKQSALDELRPSRLVDIQCDAKIQSVEEFRVGETIPCDCKGGGGTDFKPVFDHIRDKLGESPKCVVYLTDLYGSFPDKAPDYPVLWVTWTKDLQAPFGTTVYAKSA